jgi:hypothetical protein
MRVGIIRTGLRLSVSSDAGAIEPRLDVAALHIPWPLRSASRWALSHRPFGTCDYRRLRGLNFGQFSSGFSEGRFLGRSG